MPRQRHASSAPVPPGATVAGSRAERLAREVAAGHPALVQELASTIARSSRVRDFVTANEAKLRRKLRDAGTDAEALRDVRAEVRVALALLADRRFEVAWEAAGSHAGGPDFEVTWRANTRLALEVTRRRGSADAAGVLETALGKLRQLRTGMANVLVVVVSAPVEERAIADGVASFRRRVDARDAALLAFLHAATPRDVYERFDRLAAIIVVVEGGEYDDARPAVWANRATRFPLPPGVSTALAAALA